MSKMTTCKTCGAEIAKSAKVCPNCGAKRKKSKLGIILIIVGVLLVVAAFGSNDPKKVGEIGKQSETSASETKRDVFSIGDVVELDGVKTTLLSIEKSNGNDFFVPQDGCEYLICEFLIENNSTSDVNVSSIACFNCYVDDYATNLDISATVITGKTQLDGTIAVGKKMSGVVGYEVPKGWENVEIRFTPDFWSGNDITFVASNG